MGHEPHIATPAAPNAEHRLDTGAAAPARSTPRTIAAGGAVVAMAALLGMASPVGMASSLGSIDASASMARVLAHPDAALVAPSRVIAWTSVTLAVCIFLSRHAQIAIARPALAMAFSRRTVAPRPVSRTFLRASRTGGLYGG